MRGVFLENLSKPQQDTLFEAARIKERAYNPYSNFFVGACLYHENRRVLVSGCNYENASYGLTICAERAAIFEANNRGLRCWSGIAITTRGKDFDTTEATPPCGACRQVLNEVAQISGNDLTIIIATTKLDKIFITQLSKLLPGAFGPADIGIDVSKYRT